MPGKRALTILLVEDDQLVREMLAAMLASHGHTVAHVAGGSEGLAYLFRPGTTVDFVLTDARMAGMTG